MALTANVRIYPTTEYELYDFETGSASMARCVARCVGLRFDGLSLAVGLNGGDPEYVAAAGALIDALDKLRTAAMERIRAAELAAIDAASPAEDHEVIGEYTRTVAS
jgi:hypothetical protein